MEMQAQANGDAEQLNYDAMMAVVSGDSDGGDLSDEDEILVESHPQGLLPNDDEAGNNNSTSDLLYDEHLDEEDEAYVYMNLRGGKHRQTPFNEKGKQGLSTSIIANKNPSNTTAINTENASEMQSTTNDATNAGSSTTNVQKPPNSDAVLSCPCCFNIVCMDCQRHYRYENQYRAMFVMGITVDWQHCLKYDDKVQGLVRWYPSSSTTTTSTTTTLPNIVNANVNVNSKIVAPDHHPTSEKDVIYYAVSCANCQTMVAALDMNDEVYHFYDCLASS